MGRVHKDGSMTTQTSDVSQAKVYKTAKAAEKDYIKHNSEESLLFGLSRGIVVIEDINQPSLFDPLKLLHG